MTDRRLVLAAALLASFLALPAAAADTPPGSTSDTLTAETAVTDSLVAERGEVTVTRHLIAEIKAFAGSERNATALVDGLRVGNTVTLSGETPIVRAGVMTTATATFLPPTRAMGYGDVFTAVAIARQQLAAAGIVQPTPDQIKAALSGGAIVGSDPTAEATRLPGVLPLRAQGLAWPRIAERLGVPLGPIATRLKATNAAIANPVAANRGIMMMGGLPSGIVGRQGGVAYSPAAPNGINPTTTPGAAIGRRLLDANNPGAGDNGLSFGASNVPAGATVGAAPGLVGTSGILRGRLLGKDMQQ